MKTRQPHPSRAVQALARLHLLRDVAPSELHLLGADTDLVEVPAGDVIELAGTQMQFIQS